ncbi:hypothetical protein XENOCAPTIV_013604 [Xenoophorus captivus]|uniref:N-terminal Ras-GEF domain-containing protein n=1 Tax=Xenoophorus captivus TaxID=1517983 RepID=A0ABV0S2A0_9TELE
MMHDELPSNSERGMLSKVRLGSLSLRKEGERQCFLFTKHFLICTRTSGGKLHLLKNKNVVWFPVVFLDNAAGPGFSHLEFKIVVEPPDGQSFSVVLLAPSRQEKAAWTSDISQVQRDSELPWQALADLLSDARLHKDDVDICFSKTLNSCKVPQIRYASVERLLERLTDLRFLSIDFLNTFLHTYRIFTSAAIVIDKLADIYKKPFTSIPVRIEQHSYDRLSIMSLCPDYSLKITQLALDQSKSLELFFATNQGAWATDPLNNKSPRLCRKFSSPPPISIPSRTSSPVHCRKLSLSSPISVKVGALDLSTTPSSSAANSPTSSHSPSISSPPAGSSRLPFGFSSPPPTATCSPSLPQASGVSSPPPLSTKAPLDLSRGPSSPELSPAAGEDVSGELPRIDAFCGKLRRSIRRGKKLPIREGFALSRSQTSIS